MSPDSQRPMYPQEVDYRETYAISNNATIRRHDIIGFVM